MQQATRIGQLTFSDHLQRGMRETATWVLVGVAAYLIVCLASYTPQDPGWSHVGPGEQVHNAGGPPGAWFADLSLSLFGYFAYLFPLMIAWSGYLVFRNGEEEPEARIQRLALRWLGLFLTLGTASAMVEVAFAELEAGLPNGVGGGTGQLLGDWLLATLDSVNHTLLLLGILLFASFSLFSGLSWLRLLDLLGALTLALMRAGRRLTYWFWNRALRPRPKNREIEDASERREPRLMEDAVVSEETAVAEINAPSHSEPRISSPVPEVESFPALHVVPTPLSEDAFAALRPQVGVGAPPVDPAPHLEAAPEPEPSFEPTAPVSAPAPHLEVAPEPEPLSEPTPPVSAPAPHLEVAPKPEPLFEPIAPVSAPAPPLEDEPEPEPLFEPTPPVSAPAPHLEVAPEPEPLSEPTPPVSAPAPRLEAEPEPEPLFEPTAPASAPAPRLETVPEPESKPQPNQKAAFEDDSTDPDFEPEEESAPVSKPPAWTPPSWMLSGGSDTRPPQPPAAAVKPTGSSPFAPMPDEILTPPLELLDAARRSGKGYSEELLEKLSRQVESKLADFGVTVEVVDVHPGPVVTLFELMPAPGLKVSKITGLSKDIARALTTISVRVVEIIPGKAVIGLEIPNKTRETVFLSEVLGSTPYLEAKSPLTLALGTDISGHPVITDLARMPHALIAGTTGSGKSVAINAMILSLVYKANPRDVRLIMVDPKMLELSVYEGIPHLLTPVVTDMKEAANALRWCVAEMERRYKLMARLGVRNIGGYNRKVAEAQAAGEPIPDPLYALDPNLSEEALSGPPPVLDHLPFIVVVIDELADMMMVVGKKVEELIARLAQKARASGIHLLLATQRPSVDVLTGLIKANIPTRMAFQVSSRIDSRTVLDQMGAEQLLGNGDMLYLPPGTSIAQRVHGAFVDDHEVHAVVEFLKEQGEPDYIDTILADDGEGIPGIDPEPRNDLEDRDPLFDDAVQIVVETRRASISGIQRRLKIGYNRAARMVEEMERIGIVGPAETNGSREVLAPPPARED